MKIKAKPKIVVVGSSNNDMIIKLDRIPRPRETILGGEFYTAAGGKGANQAVAAARAGGNITFVGRVGRDIFGDQSIAGLNREGINVKYVTRDPVVPSGVAMIFVAKDGENSIAVAGGANGRLGRREVDMAQSAIAGADAVMIQLETPLNAVLAAAKSAARARVPVILNPAPARVLPDELFRLVTILTPNEIEAELLTGITVTNEQTAAKAAKQLRARGVPNVLLTLGAEGVFVASESACGLVPGFPLKAVDATGAGDVFNGALAVAFAGGWTLMEAARFANAAAAISVTRRGAQPSAPQRKEIDALLAKSATRRRTRVMASRTQTNPLPSPFCPT